MWLGQAEKLNELPNFYMSQSHMKVMEWKSERIVAKGEHELAQYMVTDKEGSIMFPVIAVSGSENDKGCSLRVLERSPHNHGFLQFDREVKENERLVGREYIYDPKIFNNLSGRRFKYLYANMRIAEKSAGERFEFTDNKPGDIAVKTFVYDWADLLMRAGKWDYLDYTTKCLGECEKLYLTGVNTGTLYGIMIFDRNWAFINFRDCIVSPDIRGLHIAARVKAFQFLSGEGKMINDGGDFNNPAIRSFKERMLPYLVYSVYSYENT